ncbi:MULTISPECIES: ribonuclease inhibitor [Streptomyces]|uniref:Ribonuclease inhibitor n=1 Tax=Streptomyces griseosporeus TaxID=1910 RepID=A0ABV3KGP2_STRGS|nr:ribonuclease inhibitor [Streptomyces actuosus]
MTNPAEPKPREPGPTGPDPSGAKAVGADPVERGPSRAEASRAEEIRADRTEPDPVGPVPGETEASAAALGTDPTEPDPSGAEAVGTDPAEPDSVGPVPGETEASAAAIGADPTEPDPVGPVPGGGPVGFAGVPVVVPRPLGELEPLLDWLRAGRPAGERLDFAAGTVLPDGRLDLCKQALGARGAGLVAEALGQGPSPVRHLLLGTDALGDDGAEAVAGSAVETLYLGCNGITAGGACRIADRLRASPQVVTGVWLKRNPLGSAAGRAAAELIESARTLRTLDLVQTGLDPAGAVVLADALLAAAGNGRRIARLYLGGNPLGEAGADALGAVLAAGAVDEVYVSAAQLGDAGALRLADALDRAPHGRLTRLSVASNGIGPAAAARLVTAATAAGVGLLDLGRVRAAAVLAAADNRVDLAAAETIAAALAGAEHRLAHLVLSHTGMRSREAHRLLDTAPRAATPTRFVLGPGIASSIKRRLAAFSAHIPAPAVPADVAAVRSVHRTAPPPRQP